MKCPDSEVKLYVANAAQLTEKSLQLIEKLLTEPNSLPTQELLCELDAQVAQTLRELKLVLYY